MTKIHDVIVKVNLVLAIQDTLSLDQVAIIQNSATIQMRGIYLHLVLTNWYPLWCYCDTVNPNVYPTVSYDQQGGSERDNMMRQQGEPEQLSDIIRITT